ncbi:ribonuclease HIII [Virgibacillus halodenitrificans]|uniref:ribonuclease HIII n=1 Tax=Virgibacillus halodenitrificans TaxID=1482 RepID=UPI0024BF7677|nr:ribonuclease HIII [Virgibacillus halodenitrificans]WHX27691.1 ribonuclease HIII [Virgibacillus halodenitrificans]
MSQVVAAISKDKIIEMKSFYSTYLTNTPQGAIFRAKTPNAVITAYHSGKVLFQGSNPEAEAGKWPESSNKKSSYKKTQRLNNSYAPPESLFGSNHIGTDEAGTGDYFGPITVAGVFIKKEQIHSLKTMGVKDSKNLTDSVIRKLAPEIVKLNLPYSSLVLPNEKYNRLQEKGWTQGKMKAMLHHHVIKNIFGNIDTTQLDGILIDQFCEPHVFQRHISSEKESILEKTYFMTKAESYSIAVAAASIIARSRFLSEMDLLSDKLGIVLPKGASKKVDQTIAKVILEKGESTLDGCAKTHFANTRKAQAYIK